MMPTPSRKPGNRVKSWSEVLVVAMSICFLAGCGGTRDHAVMQQANQTQSVSSPSNSELVVLLTDPDGKVGTVAGDNKGRF